MSTRHRAVALLAALSCLATVACSRDDGAGVQTATVTTGEVVQTIAAPASIAPRDRRTVSASVPGEVAQLLVDDGDEVTAGEPVVQLASDNVDLAVQQAGAAVDAAGALGGISVAPDLSPLVRSVRDQLESTIGPLIEAATVRLAGIEDPDLRARAEQELQALVSRYERTRGDLLRTERQARAATANANAAQRQAAQAQRDRAETALDAAREQRDALVLVAPIDGVVAFAPPSLRGGSGAGGAGLDGLLGAAGAGGAGPIAEGSLVAPGQPLFTVYDLGGFHASATVDEIDAVLVAEGQRATVLIDAYPDAEFDGFVRHVAIAPDTTSSGGVVYPVEVGLRGIPEDVALRVGLTASVEIVVARVDSERVVPSAALRRRDGGEVVFVVRDGVVRVVPVDVVAIGEDTAAVDGDLRAGEQVVVAGAEELDDGDPLP